MNIDNIINKLIEEQNYHSNHTTFDFLPLLIKKDENMNMYIPSINYHLLHNSNIEPYDYCWFLEKLHFQDFMFRDKSDYNINVNLTCVYLWENHINPTSYCLIWIYAICNQILRNRTDIELCKNTIFVHDIELLKSYISDYITQYKVDLPDYKKQGKIVLPKAILHNRKYNITYADEKDLTKILCAEIDYIKAYYYICPVFDLRLRETREKIGRMVQSLSE